MTLLEINKKICGRFTDIPEEQKKSTSRLATVKDLNLFNSLLSSDQGERDCLGITESYKEFYEAFEKFRIMIPDDVKEDVFYAAKMNIIYEGIPMRLVYLIHKAMLKYKNLNVAIRSIKENVLAKYLEPGVLPEGITVKDVIETYTGKEAKLITESCYKVDYDGYSEVYVANTDRVALLPSDIADSFRSLDDLRSIYFDEEKGLMFGDMPIRILGGRVGISFDEYDYRDCR